MVQELIGNRKGGATAKIIEAMFQRAREEGGESESDTEEGEEGGELAQNKLEERLVESFLNKFVIVSESSTLDHINIVILLKAIPNQIVDYNLEQMELFNFKIFQDSLIAFQNLDIVNAFEYFDEKNRERANNIKEMLLT